MGRLECPIWDGAPGASEPTAESSRRHRHSWGRTRRSLQRLVRVQCNTSLRGTKLRVAGWGCSPPPPRHRKHYTGACAHACGHDIFCGSSSNEAHGPRHTTYAPSGLETVASVSLAFLARSGAHPLCSISLVEPIPKRRTWTNSPCSVSDQSLWHRHARDAHAHACTPTPARPQNTCTYPAVVSSPSRGSYASSSACLVFSCYLISISDGSNGPGGA